MWHTKKFSKKIKELPQDVFLNSKVEKLEIIAPSVFEIDSSISNLKQLKALSLVMGSLKEVPKEVFELENLSFLKIKGGTYTKLPDVNLKHDDPLREILIFNSDLKEIPESFYQRPYLEVLNLSQNKLENLSEAIIKLKCLKKIILDNNRIKKLPCGFYRLSKLKHISLDGNPIEKDEICNLEITFNLKFF